MSHTPWNKYSCEEAKRRVHIKRLLRLAGFESSSINELGTRELEILLTAYEKWMGSLKKATAQTKGNKPND